METQTKKHKSNVKIVVYFKRKPDGTLYSEEEKKKHYNRKEKYFFCYFPKKGGGYITNHETGFDNAHAQIEQHIKENNVDKACLFLCNTSNAWEVRVGNYLDGIGWDFFHRPEFHTTPVGHRYVSRYQHLPILKNIAA